MYYYVNRGTSTYPHGKGARAVREGAVVLEQLQVHLADVVLQVEGGGEIGLAAWAWTQQHRLLQGVSSLVSPQAVLLAVYLLTLFTGVCGCGGGQ